MPGSSMETGFCADLKDYGLLLPICNHSLSPVSPTQLALVGGGSAGGISDGVWLYNVESRAWKHDRSLPKASCEEKGGGLGFHKTGLPFSQG